MAKTYTTTVSVKDPDASTFVFLTPEAYHQAISGQDIHAYAQGVDEVFIPVHAICGISVEITDDESDAPEDAYCAEV